MSKTSFLKSKWFLLLLLLCTAVVLKLFSADPLRVEQFYSRGLYPALSGGMRSMFGWLPFSIGDLLYLFAIIMLLAYLVRFLKRTREYGLRSAIRKINIFNLLLVLIGIYIYFNLAWGLNYDRLGIAYQLGLRPEQNDTARLRLLAEKLRDRTNAHAHVRLSGFPDSYSRERLQEGALAGYSTLQQELPFLKYDPVSFKSSLFGELGNYIGYTGYYNPFSAEAQLNTTIPGFLKPFVACHEIAHQLGYAKENEANFVGFLAARRSGDTSFLYSVYFDMFLYANAALYGSDSTAARRNLQTLAPEVRRDLKTLRAFRDKYQSPVETLTDIFYDRFLRLNRQPAGTATYGQVVIWLLAYEEKWGDL
jgi:hypothetical protein